MSKENYGKKSIIECRLVTYTDLGGLYIYDYIYEMNDLLLAIAL